VKADRSHRLAELESVLRREFFQSLVGRTEQVLVEGPSDTTPCALLGTSGRYAPVEIAGQIEPGMLVEAELSGVALFGS
jgi:tRNA A37 methylthiotransferase MiaB